MAPREWQSRFSARSSSSCTSKTFRRAIVGPPTWLTSLHDRGQDASFRCMLPDLSITAFDLRDSGTGLGHLWTHGSQLLSLLSLRCTFRSGRMEWIPWDHTFAFSAAHALPRIRAVTRLPRRTLNPSIEACGIGGPRCICQLPPRQLHALPVHQPKSVESLHCEVQTAGMSKVEEIPGKLVTIRFDAQKCIHSRGCVLSRPDVFVPNVEGEWIHPDAAAPEQVAELAHNCPSGAITYERSDGGAQESAPRVNLIRIRENGPLAVHAEVTLVGHGEMLRTTLCRCGHSANKPFCDGSHTAAGFVASGEPPSQPSEPLAQRDGAVTITPAENGPLLIAGSIELVTGTGRTIHRCEKTALCRCGQSANKPYCDGTHRKIGFVAPGPT
jgi:CDGSH-type Zn-finger protein/uncharacterized Fe-S cluster protein YjdI